MEERLKKFPEIITEFISPTEPALYAFDNINFFKGYVTHSRLLDKKSDKMWNFTVRSVIKPNINGIENLFLCKETAEQPQMCSENLTVEHILLSSEFNEEYRKLWE